MSGVRELGGIWTAADLAAYRAVEREPVVGEYRGARIVSAPPPSSGGIALIDALNMLSGYDSSKVDPVTRKHLIIEAMRRVYRDRAVYLGDPDFVQMPVQQLLTTRTTPPGSARRIRLGRATPSDSLAGRRAGAGGTQHNAFLDAGPGGQPRRRHDLAQPGFGSGLVVPGTGVLLNNPMDDFSVKPGVPNIFGLGRCHGQRDRAGQAHALVRDADVRRDAAGRDDRGFAGRQLHHQHGAAGDARLASTA